MRYSCSYIENEFRKGIAMTELTEIDFSYWRKLSSGGRPDVKQAHIAYAPIGEGVVVAPLESLPDDGLTASILAGIQGIGADPGICPVWFLLTHWCSGDIPRGTYRFQRIQCIMKEGNSFRPVTCDDVPEPQVLEIFDWVINCGHEDRPPTISISLL